MTPYSIVLTTLPDQETARQLASVILNHHLGACVQIIGPIESHYIWEGKAEQSTEFQLSIKTKEVLYPKLEELIKTNHPYQCPEIIQIPISRGSTDYLNWIKTTV